jgi:hypothetical protein
MLAPGPLLGLIMATMGTPGFAFSTAMTFVQVLPGYV